MSLYNVPDLDIGNETAGMDTLLIEVMEEVPSFIPALLFFIFMTILLGGSVSQRKRTGSSDTPMWAVIAGISTLMVALPLTLSAGLVDMVTLSVLVVVTIASGFWFFMSRSRSEAF
ncbi:hypothetical protein LCGC14_2190850 [marine sediment metagenome]|uniref:Uncharacterized protein n=1 Tax=marine sediment metagenome TaxID=412755 RepID=A0A0F9DJS2_9ZZZZ